MSSFTSAMPGIAEPGSTLPGVLWFGGVGVIPDDAIATVVGGPAWRGIVSSASGSAVVSQGGNRAAVSSPGRSSATVTNDGDHAEVT